MIFEEVVLRNFGVYKGSEIVSLAVSSERPIVLIGALNGAGKTTFLDAMQLALYGKSAKCTGREKVGYHEYLESMINREVPASTGAGVEFAFRSRVNGQDSQIRIIRNWQKRGQGLHEHLEILRDGNVDAVASERWQEFVEDLMPSQIADLFFFDGEKIEALADPLRSAALLKVGVHSLLGIDLIESLCRSLQQVEKKRKAEAVPESERAELGGLQQQALELRQEQEIARQRAAGLTTDVDTAQRVLESAAADFSRLGGDLYNRRNQLDAEHQELLRRKLNLEEQLREIAGGFLPLQLVRSLVDMTISKAKILQNSHNLEGLKKEVTGRDEDLLVFLNSIRLDKPVIRKVSDFLEKDRASRYGKKREVFDLPVGLLEEYRSDELDRHQQSARILLQELADTKERIEAVKSNLDAVPAEALIAQAQAMVDIRRKELATIEVKQAMALEEVAAIEVKLERLNLQITRESDRLGDQLLKEDVSQRVIIHSARSRETLGRFRDRLLRENLGRLQASITTCFQKLLRKQTLVRSVLIDPDSFQLSVIHTSGSTVPAHRLSAGERQLLAIATVWALSHASGRHLPAVVDTPLSRLDSRHRNTIVKNYFPMASHQVILLSTDEEIVGNYYKQLKPYIGCQYLIEYDDKQNTSHFVEGYFSQMADLEAA